MGLVNVLDEEGECEAAEELCRDVAAAQAATLGDQHPDTL